jgi:DNA-binding PadR family transcriptional regulator
MKIKKTNNLASHPFFELLGTETFVLASYVMQNPQNPLHELLTTRAIAEAYGIDEQRVYNVMQELENDGILVYSGEGLATDETSGKGIKSRFFNLTDNGRLRCRELFGVELW